MSEKQTQKGLELSPLASLQASSRQSTPSGAPSTPSLLRASRRHRGLGNPASSRGGGPSRPGARTRPGRARCSEAGGVTGWQGRGCLFGVMKLSGRAGPHALCPRSQRWSPGSRLRVLGFSAKRCPWGWGRGRGWGATPVSGRPPCFSAPLFFPLSSHGCSFLSVFSVRWWDKC